MCPAENSVYDGHTLAAVTEEIETLTGREVERVYVDKGCRGHDAPTAIWVATSSKAGTVTKQTPC